MVKAYGASTVRFRVQGPYCLWDVIQGMYPRMSAPNPASVWGIIRLVTAVASLAHSCRTVPPARQRTGLGLLFIPEVAFRGSLQRQKGSRRRPPAEAAYRR